MSDQDFFFHKSGVARVLLFDERLKEMRVDFETEQQPDGRLRAVNVRPVGTKLT